MAALLPWFVYALRLFSSSLSLKIKIRHDRESAAVSGSVGDRRVSHLAAD